MTQKQKNLVFLVICFALVFAIYSQSLFGSFVFDDRSIVEHQSLFENLNNLPRVLLMGYWTQETGLYRPIVLISYVFNYSLFGSDAWSFHLVNLILYALTGYLLFLLIKRVFPKRKLLAYLTPLLFLVLPIHTEAVANIVGRAEILALFFSLLAFLEVVKKKTSPWKIAFWLILALASKETAIAAFPIILLLLFIKHAKFVWHRALYMIIPLFLSASVYFTARFLVLGQYFFSNNATLTENPLKFVCSLERISTSLKILVMYVKKSFCGFQLCSDYSYNQIPIATNFFNLETLIGLAIFLFLVITTIIFLGRMPVLALGSAFFLFGFLPVSNLILPIGTIAGERLMFFPSVGLCLYLAQALIFLRSIKPRKLFRLVSIVLTVVLLCFYAGKSFARNFDWSTEKALFISAGQCASNSVLSRSNLGTVYYFEGKYDEAEQEFLDANQIYDKYSKAINNLGLVYWKKGEYEKAKQEYFRAIKNWPPYEGVYENLALLYLSQGEIEQARKWLSFGFESKQAADNYLNNYLIR